MGRHNNGIGNMAKCLNVNKSMDKKPGSLVIIGQMCQYVAKKSKEVKIQKEKALDFKL